MLQWTKEKLGQLSLFEVRSIAREIGVKSPTLYNKEEVIQKILDITSGVEEPYVKSTNKGRPAKPIGSTVEILDLFMPTKLNKKEFSLKDDNKTLTLKSNIQPGRIPTDFTGEAVEIEEKGYLDILNDGYGFIRNNYIADLEKDTFVPEAMIRQLDLKKGDYLDVVKREMSGGKIGVTVSVNKINNKPIPLERYDFDKLKSIYPTEAYTFVDKELNIFNNYLLIGKGQRMLFLSESLKLINKHMLKLYKSISVKNKEFIYFNAQPEEMAMLEKENIIHFINAQSSEIQLRAVELVIENAKRKAEMGEDAVVFINNIMSVVNIISGSESLSPSIEMSNVSKLNNLLLNGKNTKEAGSVTIIIGLDLRDEKGKMLAPLLSSSINFNSTLSERLYFMNIFPCVDFSKQEIDRPDELLDNSHLKHMKQVIYDNINNMPNITKELSK